MERFLIDTNVISDYLSGSMPENGLILIDEIIDAIPNISIIIQIELLCWNADSVTLNNMSI
jgi:predicted nucleic acid-binding protein